MKDWLCLSLRPRSIEFNLLGFGNFNKNIQKNKLKIIRSPMKPIQMPTVNRYYNRSSYVTFEKSLTGNDKTLIVVFEATTSKINFTVDIVNDLHRQNDKYTTAMKKLIHKLCQLERQIYYLSFYYSVSLNQIFGGLALFELYRDSLVNPDDLLDQIMSSEIIRGYVPLLFRLFKIHQFILT
jgi:hypothetical protein